MEKQKVYAIFECMESDDYFTEFVLLRIYHFLEEAIEYCKELKKEELAEYNYLYSQNDPKEYDCVKVINDDACLDEIIVFKYKNTTIDSSINQKYKNIKQLLPYDNNHDAKLSIINYHTIISSRKNEIFSNKKDKMDYYDFMPLLIEEMDIW